jgi:beta-ribofuranosylaminobenzene 5'-phosphate synthase
MQTLSPLPPHKAPRAAVRVRTPGRLHLGFLDPSATLGRRFGSIGLFIDGFETELELEAAAADAFSAADDEARAELPRAAEFLHALRQASGQRQALALRLHRVLPAHAGFGSGTQLALALGRAFATWHGLAVDTPTLARWLGRGLRSGVGIAGFDRGGLLVDGGPDADGRSAPLLARLPLPTPWRIVVVQDPARRGLHGADERRAIATLPPLPREHAADCCHQVLMRLLPGAAATDHAAFAAGLNALQQRLGAHFAPAQGGSAWASPAVARLLEWARVHCGDGAGIGQSSWGPTGFAVLPSKAAARALLDAAAAAGVIDPALKIDIVAARNEGAELDPPRSGFAAPPQGGAASALAEPDPRRPLGKTA